MRDHEPREGAVQPRLAGLHDVCKFHTGAAVRRNVRTECQTEDSRNAHTDGDTIQVAVIGVAPRHCFVSRSGGGARRTRSCVVRRHRQELSPKPTRVEFAPIPQTCQHAQTDGFGSGMCGTDISKAGQVPLALRRSVSHALLWATTSLNREAKISHVPIRIL